MRACRNCRMILNEDKTCPNCQGTDLTEKFSGQIIILDAERSEVAKVAELKGPGKFAIRVK
ncbi:Transcription elongation factor Spt4 [uncultured archaeon]|nr:Transcription elongation factor Spt4 [uncultured archaeon]